MGQVDRVGMEREGWGWQDSKSTIRMNSGVTVAFLTGDKDSADQDVGKSRSMDEDPE